MSQLIRSIMKLKVFLCLAIILLLGSSSSAIAAENELSKLSLAELLLIKVNTASNKMKSKKEQPGTITVITESQIASSGARNLMQLLLQVPGFWVGTDTIGTLSVSFRGVWGMEAKILLIIDGIEQNELAFGTLVLGHRYPTNTIKQVEIIRGPGAVKYGGQAALAVIKVTSKDASKNDLELSFSSDFDREAMHNSTISLVTGGSLGEEGDWRYSLSSSFGNGDYSDERWVGLDGYSFELIDRSNSRPANLNFGIANNQFNLRFIYDRFEQEDQLLFGDAGLFVSPFLRYTQPNTLTFESYNLAFGYQWQPTDKLLIESKLTFAKQKPWNSESQYDQRLIRKAERNRVDLSALYDVSEKTNFLLGLSYYTEKERILVSHLFDASTRFDGSDRDEMSDIAVFFQLESETDWLTYTIGGRYEENDFSGNHFVPRVAFTKSWDKLYGKLVYNEAFKFPQFDTIASAKNAGTPIEKTESTEIVELELGYQFSENFTFSGNLYDMKVLDYIGFNPITISNTTLGDFSGNGAELIANWQSETVSASVSFSTFNIKQTNIEALTVERDKDAILGIPNHMLKLQGQYFVSETDTVNLTGSLISGRYACVEDVNFVCGAPEKLSSELSLDLFYRYEAEQWAANVGIANLLNEETWYVQPYRGSQSPIPGLGRRLTFDLNYRF